MPESPVAPSIEDPKKRAKVRSFFDDTAVYLRADYNIALRSRIVAELLGEVTNAKVIDVGCGDGSISRWLVRAGNQVTLLDLSPKMLELALQKTPVQHRAAVTSVQEDISSYRTDEKFDVVLCIGVLAHVHSVGGALHKIEHLLAPGGRAVIQFTDHDQVSYAPIKHFRRLRNRLRNRYGYALHETTDKEIRALAAESGLVFRAERRYATPPPLLGRLFPGSWLYRYEVLTLTTPSLSKFGWEVVALLSR